MAAGKTCKFPPMPEPSDPVPIPDLADYALQLQVLRAWDAEMAKPRHADPKRILRYGFKIYSQNDEDGIIQEIFRRIGVTNRSFVEFGVATGLECNTVKLLVEGWQGLWIEADRLRATSIRASFDAFGQEGRLTVLEQHVTAENIDALLSAHAAGEIGRAHV